MSGAYYNEIDPKAAAWLRELIRRNLIAPGDVDERSIEDVRPIELRGYTQCHFFAGIGGWSRALRLAGWPDHERVWTGSCPCQSFSAAGKGAGFADERHLWPAWHHLIRECRPDVVFGEQVEAAIAYGWTDLVQADLENDDYAVGFVGIPAAGVGAPHIRARLWFVADANHARLEGRHAGALGHERTATPRGGGARGMGDTHSESAGRYAGSAHATQAQHGPFDGHHHGPRHAGRGLAVGLADATSQGWGRQWSHSHAADGAEALRAGQAESGRRGAADFSSPLHGYWRDADWLGCRDGKFRPVEPGTFSLANGAAERVVRLRGYGNAINAEVAAAFIRAYLDVRAAA